MDIHVLHQQNMSIRKIAEILRISRNTVRRYLRSEAVPRYKRDGSRPTKLAAYCSYISVRIQAAEPDWIPATVIFREIKELGYSGGIAQLRRYMALHKTAVPVDPVIRFETLPGQQMQIDFTTIRKGKMTLKAFVATLGYSRASYVYFTDNERASTWRECLVKAFEFFGGVPAEVLCDNAKALIIQRDHYGKGHHKYNEAFLALSKQYGFQIKACRPYRAKTKGKVERFNHYLKNSFVVPLKAELKQQNLTLDVDIANAKVGYWLNDVANVREHGTTKLSPMDQLKIEKDHFAPLPVFTPLEEETIATHSSLPISCELLQHPLSYYDQVLEVRSDAY